MAGELWREVLQIGKETTPGTAVPATRKLYGMNVSMSRTREARLHSFATGTPDQDRAQTLGAVQAAGSFEMPLSADELIEAFLMSVQGGVTPTTPATATTTRLWTFKPGVADLDSATIERDDAAKVKKLIGTRVDSIQFQGSVGGENKVTLNLFGTDYADLSALTGSLSSRLPTFIEGWETKAFLDAAGGTPGTTALAGLLDWNITIARNLGRVYTANNTLAANRIAPGVIKVSGSIGMDAQDSAAQSLVADWDAETYRILRLDWGNNETIETTFKRFVTLDVLAALTDPGFNDDDQAIRKYTFNFNGLYDTALAAMCQVRAQNDRTAAY